MVVTRALVERLERSAAALGAATAAGFSAGAPDDPATSASLRSGALVALGPGRYVNRAVGVTLDGLDDAELDRLEAFFTAAGVPASVEVCSWAPADLLPRLTRRGYEPDWFRDVLVRPVGVGEQADRATDAEVVVRTVDDDAVPTWQRVLADGNDLTEPADRAVSDAYAAAAHRLPGALDLRADVRTAAGDEPAGCGSLVPSEGVGWLGGAATVPAFRGRGVQGRLLRERVRRAGPDVDLLAATALADGASARNLRRHGFTLACTQLVLSRRPDGG